MMKTHMKDNSRLRIAVGVIMASTLMLSVGATCSIFSTSPAEAVSLQEYHRKVQNNAALRRKLSGVSKKLADKILELNDLNERQIPKQLREVEQAEQRSEQARNLADATNQRLESAKKG